MLSKKPFVRLVYFEALFSILAVEAVQVSKMLVIFGWCHNSQSYTLLLAGATNLNVARFFWLVPQISKLSVTFGRCLKNKTKA